MDTIALWEEEIAESNRSHFFENTAKAIDYLMESIELDYKLVEAGIITEADEEDTSSNDNDAPNDATDSANSELPSSLKIGKKIKLFLEKIGFALMSIAKKITNYFSGKAKDFQKKHIQDKFMTGKIDEDKLVEKLNKAKLFDPKETYDTYCENGVFGTVFAKFLDRTLFSIGDEEYYRTEANKYNAKLREFESLFNPEDFQALNDKDKYESVLLVKIDKNNVKAQIKKLYEETNKYMEDIEERVKYFSNAMKRKESEIDKIKTKDQLKHAKSVIQAYKSAYKGCVRISGLYLKQSTFLANIMLGFSRNGNAEEGNTEENTEKEEA
jgi:hypothetical protein